jgi:CO/xanthine dehydrogenase Mo-binding subunit
MKAEYKTIGQNIPKVGIEKRLRGEPIFSADLALDNPLILRVLRSTQAHAYVRRINYETALGIKGVVRIFTSKDIPGKNLTGIINKDQPLLATDKVRSIGEPVVLVAAETETAADLALGAIDVTYEALPAVFSPAEALAPGAPKIHEKGNLLFTRTLKRGNVDEAFTQCEAIVEKTYLTSRIEHSYLEPDAGAGYVDYDDTLVIFASTQNPHYDLKEVVGLLGLEEEQVRIVQAATGGGFGSKLDLNMQGFIGLALYHLKKPVRMVYTREEAYLATAKRHPLEMKIKTGADRNGKLLAMQAVITCDTGAYASYGIPVASRSAVHATGPYEVEAVAVASRCVYTNNPFCGAMRGFGTPQMAIAHESQMDLLARELGMDSLEIRRINALRPGSKTGTGQTLTASVGISDCLNEIQPYYAQAKTNWQRASIGPYKKRGVGLGCMWYGIGNTGVQNPSTARITMDMNGRRSLGTCT